MGIIANWVSLESFYILNAAFATDWKRSNVFATRAKRKQLIKFMKLSRPWDLRNVKLVAKEDYDE
jgi:hypothetical protein